MIEACRSDGLSLNERAKVRMLSRRGKPLFIADWERVLMIHFEVNADDLQREVPFELDLHDGRAFVSLVAFTLRGMRPRMGGRLAAWLLRPVATHDFLNFRTYVRHGGETGIYFLAEWLSNRLAVQLGPAIFGLPYQYGRISYHHEWRGGELRGRVTDEATDAALAYRAKLPSQIGFETCETGSLAEWLMERYTAFTYRRNQRRFFRVWHPSWPQCGANVVMSDISLVNRYWPWFSNAHLIGANFSPGFRDVWMGRPWAVEGLRASCDRLRLN
jgi:uncharacterized protein YqjF (DUF2071 family)